MASIISRVWSWTLRPPLITPRATVLIRLFVGAVFFSEGVLKFVYPGSLGTKRFELIGIPFSNLVAPFDGIVEIVCGALLILGLLTRFAAIPLIIDILVAIASTKITLYLGTSALPPPPVAPQSGLFGALHEGRTDYAQLLGSVFLLVVGPGRWSLDALVAGPRRREAEDERLAQVDGGAGGHPGTNRPPRLPTLGGVSGASAGLVHWFLHPPLLAPRSTILVRLLGAVFVSEGILKFIFGGTLGTGRFDKIGIPMPGLLSPFVGVVEIVCGALLMAGLLTRFAAVPMLIDMLVATTSTKIPLFFGISALPPAPVPPQSGLWAVLHEVRSEYAQFLAVLFLLAVGPGLWSLDALIARRTGRGKARQAERSHEPEAALPEAGRRRPRAV